MLDAVVVGAGASGVGAGLALLKHRANFLILEAKDRVGGRAYSDSESLGRIWDHGCHWFHSASINPLRKIALKLGHPFEDTPKPYGSWLWRNGAFTDPTPYETEHAALAARMAAADTATADLPLASLMDDASSWRAVLRHDMALTYSQEVEDISIADAKAFHDTQENIPVTGGYGALIARLAQTLPVRHSTAVTAITVVPGGVKISTASGDIEARQVIVAVPQRVLARGAIRFSPALPADIAEAIDSLPMGWFEKAGFAFSAQVFGEQADSGVEILARVMGEDWPTPVQISGGAEPIAICHLAGHAARDLAAADRLAFSEDALVQCFGSRIRSLITRRAASAWTTDPFIGGAYSCARPGAAGLRRTLQHPVHDHIQFAGEHTSSDAMATAHGAYLSGQAAAMRALQIAEQEADPLWLPDQV